MFTRRPASKVLPCHQDLRAAIPRLVENELRIGSAGVRSLLNAPPIEEEEFTVAGALDPLEELLGNDLIRIDIDPVERSGKRGQFAKWLHFSFSTPSGWLL